MTQFGMNYLNNTDMKTKEQAAKEYVSTEIYQDNVFNQNEDFNKCYIAGAEFANQWTDVSTKLPPYYKGVNVTYEKQGHCEMYDDCTTCWLAVGDNGEYIWTVSGTDVVLPNGVVKKWKPIEI